MESGRKFYRIVGGQNIRMKELVFRGENLAICPDCGNGNAMMFGCWPDKDGKDVLSYTCRDCGVVVNNEDAVKIYTVLDKPGMGNQSTYSVVRQVIGLGN